MELDARTSGLPVPRTALIGREQTLAELHEIMASAPGRLLTLTGVGGSGKTRLALQLAADLAPDYPQRTWVVELATVTNADLVPIVVATAVGLVETTTTDTVKTLADFLASPPALLLLDNCEHLIDASAALVDTLLTSCPDLRILASSRESLQIAGEQQYRVPPLAMPDLGTLPRFDAIATAPAVELFVTRARAALPSFQLTPDNAAAVAAICSRLGGIPLALELAAARVGVLGVEQILARLDDSFRLLTGGSRVAPTRHQTLRAALDWSDALLAETERTVFRRLAVFAGEFQLEAAEAVCADADLPADDVLDVLTGLVNKSLVVVASEERTAWYHLLEPVRQYARAQMQERDELSEIWTRHAWTYVTLAERASAELHGPNQEAWLKRLEREQGNLRSALEWTTGRAEVEAALRLVSALVPFWEAHAHLVEGQRWLHLVLALPGNGVDPAWRMRALRGVGGLTFLYAGDERSRYVEAEILHRESLQIARAIGDRQGIASALAELGMVYRLQRDLVRSQEVLSEALDRFRELDDSWGIALTTLNLGSTLGYLGDTTRAECLISDGLERFRALGDLRYVAIAQVLLSRVALMRGEIDGAVHLSVDAMTTHSRLDDRWFVTFDLMALADALITKGCSKQAVKLYAAARALSEALSSLVGGVSFKDLLTTIDSLRREPWFEVVWQEGYALEPRDAVLVGRALLDEPGARGPLTQLAQPELAPLTRRELEVARLLAKEYTDREIADELFLSVRTVGVHVHHILQKLGLRSRVEVAAWLDTNTPASAER